MPVSLDKWQRLDAFCPRVEAQRPNDVVRIPKGVRHESIELHGRRYIRVQDWPEIPMTVLWEVPDASSG